MIECREAVRRMWAYLDRSLDPSPTDELEAHLETCQRCCGELEFSRHVRERVAATDASTVLPPELKSRVEGLIGRATSEAEGPR
jgi:anti-sigma factor (TIGR02949 family)